MNNLLKGINVFLIGMMGTGKTTVGKILAQQLNYRFFDTDVLIERVADRKIREIFANEGEENFRQLETQVLREVSAYTKSAIATGGGIVLRQQNWSYLHYGLIVWLDAPPELLIERLADDNTRPLLKDPNPSQKLNQILEARRPIYTQADLHVEIEKYQTPEQIASQIIEMIPTVVKPTAISGEYN